MATLQLSDQEIKLLRYSYMYETLHQSITELSNLSGMDQANIIHRLLSSAGITFSDIASAIQSALPSHNNQTKEQCNIILDILDSSNSSNNKSLFELETNIINQLYNRGYTLYTLSTLMISPEDFSV